ncbi:pyridoxamine 5'-phosphate oxidase family protein [Actinomycetota bacterium Odt1-20B]
MTADDDLLKRSRHLLDTARYVHLATASEQGEPWAATLEYAWFADPLRLVFGSATDSRHSHDVWARPQVSGSLFRTDGTNTTDTTVDFTSIDGAQFTGRCTEIPPDRLATYYEDFYATVFPDPRRRAEWQLPSSLLQHPAPHRLYLVEIDRWWLIDTRTWAEDRIDRRIEVPVGHLER